MTAVAVLKNKGNGGVRYSTKVPTPSDNGQ